MPNRDSWPTRDEDDRWTREALREQRKRDEASEIERLKTERQGYYNEASEGWAKYRQAEREIAELKKRVTLEEPEPIGQTWYEAYADAVRDMDDLLSKNESLRAEIAQLKERPVPSEDDPVCGCDAAWPGQGHHPECPVSRQFAALVEDNNRVRARNERLERAYYRLRGFLNGLSWTPTGKPENIVVGNLVAQQLVKDADAILNETEEPDEESRQ